MTELEKQFFDTFEIEPKYKTCIFKYCKNKKEYDCENCNDKEWHYPEITDHILLELICIVSERRILPNCDVNGLKEYVLKELCTMIMSEKTKQQVKALFKEE